MRGPRVLLIVLALAVIAPACRGGGTRMGIPTTTEPPGMTREEGILTVGGSVIPDPPFSVIASDGTMSGFETELLAEIAARLGLVVERVDLPPDTLTAQLALGTVDVVAARLPIADSATIRFSRPYHGSGEDERLGFAVDAAGADLLGQLDAALAAMLVDGAYQTIYDTWFDTPEGSVLYVPPAAALGSPGRPLRIYAVPSVDPRDLLSALRELAAELEARTGISFEVAVPATYAETIDALCAFPEESIGFLSPPAVVAAADRCGATPALAALRLGETVTRSEFLVRRDAAIDGLEDLAGLTWAHPGIESLTGDLVPEALLADAGVTPGAEILTGSHVAAVQAVYSGEADFATVWFSPSTDKDGVVAWDGTVAGADIPEDLLWSCATISTGELVCADGLRPRDARIGLRETTRDVIQMVRILTISEPIANDAMVFGPDLPDDLRLQVIEAMVAFASDDTRGFAEALDPLAWHGLVPVTAADYELIRWVMATLDLDGDDL